MAATGHRGGRQHRVLPEDAELPVRRRWRIGCGGVVDDEGEDEVQLDVGVDRHVAELDTVEDGADVVAEEVGVCCCGRWGMEEGDDKGSSWEKNGCNQL
jgi:hypothetical protein